MQRPQRIKRPPSPSPSSGSGSGSAPAAPPGPAAWKGKGARRGKGKAAVVELQQCLVIPKRVKNEGPLSQYPLAFLPPSVALSRLDRAAELVLSEDQLSVRSEMNGYRMIRATHGFHHGVYYYECEVSFCDNDASFVRVGWSSRFGELQAPVGFDSNSFGYCSGDGSKVHQRLRDQSYSANPFKTNDIVGCYIRLDEVNPDNNEMRFFKNGVDQGVAYSGSSDIPIGVYFPAISLFGKAEIRVNFGPSFILKHDIYGANGCSEAQPMNPDDRKEHDMRIEKIRQRFEMNGKSAVPIALAPP